MAFGKTLPFTKLIQKQVNKLKSKLNLELLQKLGMFIKIQILLIRIFALKIDMILISLRKFLQNKFI